MLLSTKLNQRAKVLVAAGALALVTLAALPGAAEAQQDGAHNANQSVEAPTTVQALPEPAERVVVNPGDSLWSISQRQLGPNATAQQIAAGVQQIYELNRERIGPDPNLIFPGQQFLLPALFKPAPAPPPTPASATAPEQPAGSAAPDVLPSTVVQEQVPSQEPAHELAPNQAPQEQAAPEEAAQQQAAPEPNGSEHIIPSDQPTSEEARPIDTEKPRGIPVWPRPATREALTATVASLTTFIKALIDFYNNHKPEPRQLIGLGIIALTLAIAALMAWKLPYRRNIDAASAWRLPREHYKHHTSGAEAVQALKEEKSGTPSESIEDTRGPAGPTEPANAESASDSGSVYPSLTGQRRQERLRRIRKRTIHKRRRPRVQRG